MHDWLTIELVLGILLVTSFTCVGLLALWAATSPRHWFVPTAVVLAALSPLLLVPAYEPYVVFVLQAAIVALGVSISRWRQKRRNRPQSLSVRFSLGSFLLATVLIAIAVVIATKLPKLNVDAWITMVLMGVAAGVATLVGSWMFAANRKLIAWPVGLMVCLCLGTILAFTDWFVPSIVGLVGWPPDDSGGALAMLGYTAERPTATWLFVVPFLTLLLVLLLLFWRVAFGYEVKSNDEAPLLRRTTKVRLLSLGFFFVLLALIAYFPLGVLGKLLSLDPLPDTALPNPNGYDEFIAAGEIVTGLPINGSGGFDYETATQQALAVEVAKCDAVYEKVALGLSRSCRAPVDYTFSAGSLPMDHLMSLRGLARALAGKARLAALEGRHEDAVRIHLDLVQFGHAIRHGGLLIDGIIGVACSSIGLSGVNETRLMLSPTAAAQCVTTLVEIDAAEESYDDIWYRDRIWMQRAYGWHGHLQQLLSDLANSIPSFIFFSPDEYPYTFWTSQAITRLIACDLALAQFNDATGQWPESLTELVPAYLPAIPVDPLDPEQLPIKYRRDGESYLLYSVGPNGVDDGGTAPEKDDMQRQPQTGDLRLDLYFAPEIEEASATAAGGDSEETSEPDDKNMSDSPQSL